MLKTNPELTEANVVGSPSPSKQQQFLKEPLLHFVFMDPDKRGDDTLTDAEKLKAELIASTTVPDEASDLGDRFMLQAYYPERDNVVIEGEDAEEEEVSQ